MHPASQRSLRFAQVFLVATVLICVASALAQTLNSAPDQSPVAESMINSSEGIHHLAGCALVGSALLILIGQSSPRLRFLQAVLAVSLPGRGSFFDGVERWRSMAAWIRGLALDAQGGSRSAPA